MLFNSLEFILAFLPVTLIGFFLLGRPRPAAGGDGLGGARLPVLLRLLGPRRARPDRSLALVAADPDLLLDGLQLPRRPALRAHRSKALLLDRRRGQSREHRLLQVRRILRRQRRRSSRLRPRASIVLPLGISFFTFQQIAYLVDAYRGEVARDGFVDYALFVTFFPQLIAGPIVHHSEMMPQFARPRDLPAEPRQPVASGSRSSSSGCSRRSCWPTASRPIATPVFAAAQAGDDADPVRGLGRRARLHLPALFRLLRLLGHGDRARPDVRHPAAAQLQLALQGGQHHRLLAPLAHHAVALPARLPLHPARRQPARRRRAATSTCDHDAARRPVARRRLDLRGLGRAARRLSGGQPRSGRRAAPARPRPGAHDLLGRVAARSITFLAVVVAWVFFRAELRRREPHAGRHGGLNGIWLPASYFPMLGPLAPTLEALGWVFEEPTASFSAASRRPRSCSP